MLAISNNNNDPNLGKFFRKAFVTNGVDRFV